MLNSQSEELFIAPKSTSHLKLLGAVLAVAVTALVFIGYTYLRNRHAKEAAATAASLQPLPSEPKGPPQALITINDALLQGSKTVIGGTVTNTSGQRLGPLTVELELKHRKGGASDKTLRTVMVEPAQLEPQQEGRYSVELVTREYSAARVIALRANGALADLPYTTALGRKRPLERTESKTITVDQRQPGTKSGEFLNSPDNPARIP